MKEALNSRPMPIILPILWSCNVIELLDKVIKQLESRVNLLIEIKLKEQLGT